MMVPTPNPFATPPAFATAQPTPSSERDLLRRGLIGAGERARALGGTLGVVVIDLGSGAVGELNGDASLPMRGVQRLLVAIVAYAAADRGTLPLDRVVANDGENVTVRDLIGEMLVDGDDSAAKTLTDELGGIDALNAAIRDLGFDKIVAGAHDNGVATPVELAKLLGELFDGHVLRASSRSALMATLSSVQGAPGRLRAGLPERAQLAHAIGTSTADGPMTVNNDIGIASFFGRKIIVVAMLSGAAGTPAQRDAILAAVAQAGVNAVNVTP
ncbi:MAG TPA: serine hydrolase [Candidatus Baltobacteraceae bacterium]|nr:serine hydrolase [Candidatus Baltobacteraceae bacterium]